ncbi:MAG TPA: type II secretion system F family protein [Fimbriimonadaceae bacterium]|nr:type II secretion system F family protein [Fimbriimonadaceae bacterium]
MPVYEYSARNRQGKLESGTLNAESERDLREALRSDSLFLTQYKVQYDATSPHPQEGGLFTKKVKLRDMVVMSRQLATLVRAGLPINEALNTCASQTENRALSNVLKEVRIDIIGGESMSQAMRKHPRIFTELYCSLVEAGETGGVLDRTLDVAADQFDKEAELRERVKAALTYPVIVIIAAVAVVAFMLLMIVPTFAKVYVQFHAELPIVTKMLVSLSAFMVQYTWVIFVGIFVIFFAARYYNRTDQGRHFFDLVKLKMPLVGKILRKVAIARFCQTFSSMTNGGVPIIKALNVAGNTTGNVIIRDSVMTVAVAVQEGETFSRPLEATGQFPPMVTKMIASGEDSGNLPEMLDEINKFYERDIEYSVDRLTKIMEPLLTVVVGGIVLFVLLALYYPVFNLTQVIRR